mgnify:CR=1 FL=1
MFPIKGCKGFLALILALLLPLTALAEYPIILLEPELASMAVEAVQVLGVELPPDAVFCKILTIDDGSVIETEDTSWSLYDPDGSLPEPIYLSVTFDSQNRLKSIHIDPPATDVATDDLEALQAQFQTAYIEVMDTLCLHDAYTFDDVFFLSWRPQVDVTSPDGDWHYYLGLRGDGSRPWDNALLTFFWHPGSDHIYAIDIDRL